LLPLLTDVREWVTRQKTRLTRFVTARGLITDLSSTITVRNPLPA